MIILTYSKTKSINNLQNIKMVDDFYLNVKNNNKYFTLCLFTRNVYNFM